MGSTWGDPVVVNPSGGGSDEFAFMNPDANPYEAPQETQQNGGGDAQMTEDTQPSQQENVTEDIFANMDNQEEDATDAYDNNEVKKDEIANEQKEKSEDEPTFLSVWQEERKLELEKRRSKEKE